MTRTALAFGLAGLMVFFLAVKTTRKDHLLGVGSMAPRIYATTLDGSDVTLDFNNERTVLWVLDSIDGAGEFDAPKFSELFHAKAADYRFIALSLSQDGAKDFARRVPGLAMYVATRKTVEDYGTWRTMVIAIGRGGVVEKRWVDSMDYSQSDIEQFFHVTFTTPSRLTRHNSR